MKKGSINPHLYRARIGKCLICGKKYRAIKDFKERKQKYCSKKCWNKRNPPTKKNCELCKKEFESYQREKKYCSLQCRNEGMIGGKLSKVHSENISKALKGKIPKNAWKSGELHPFWKKDRTIINALDTKEYNELRLRVFKRDDYTCGICKRRGKKVLRIILELHHIKPKKDYPELFWEINNCQTICNDCHKKTESYLNRWI